MRKFAVAVLMGISLMGISLTGYAENIYSRLDAKRPSESITLIGKADKIYRGDRFSIDTKQGSFVVQLDNIHCDERNAGYGEKAYDFSMDALKKSKQVIVSVRSYEQNGKALLCGTILIGSDVTGLEYELLRRGYADVGGGTGIMLNLYKDAASEAIEARRGMWSKNE